MAVKQFLVKSALFSLPIILILGFAEYKLSKIPSAYEQKIKDFWAKKDSCQILFLGNSHIQNGVDTKWLNSKSINMSFGSQTLYQDAYIMNLALENMPQLRTVVLGVDYHTLYNVMEGEKWREHFYLKYYNLSPRVKTHSLIDIHKYSYLALHGGETSLSLLKPDISKPNNKPGIDKRATMTPPLGGSVEEYYFNAEVVKDRVKFFNSRYSEKSIQENLRYLCPKLEKARNKKINVIMIETPCHESFNTLLDKGILRRNTDIIDSLKNTFGIRYYSYAEDKRFTKSDFVNPDHLNIKGAYKFTTLLKEEVLSKF